MRIIAMVFALLVSIGAAHAQVSSVGPFMSLSIHQQGVVPITLVQNGRLLPATDNTTLTVTGGHDSNGLLVVSVALEGSQIVITPVNAGGPVLINVADGNGNHFFINVVVVGDAFLPPAIKDTNPLGAGPYEIISQ